MEWELAMHLQTEASISDQNVSMADRLDVAVLIPCYNEADTIRNTVRAFRGSVPSARIYVFDNNSARCHGRNCSWRGCDPAA